jgi:hypothetical protein
VILSKVNFCVVGIEKSLQVVFLVVDYQENWVKGLDFRTSFQRNYDIVQLGSKNIRLHEWKLLQYLNFSKHFLW